MNALLVYIVVQSPDEGLRQLPLLPALDRMLQNLFKTRRLHHPYLVVQFINPDRPGRFHPLAQQVDDLLIQGVDLFPVIAKRVLPDCYLYPAKLGLDAS